MSLAVSYTNESLRHHACDALYRWLMHNPRYAHLISDAASVGPSLMYDTALFYAPKQYGCFHACAV